MRINKKLTQAVAGTVSSSIIISSCTPLNSFSDNTDLKNENMDFGESVIPIYLIFDPEHISYIVALQQLGNDIITDPSIAKRFASNPIEILKEYGYTDEVNLDDSLIKLITALGDDDINNAIKNKDIYTFLSLCEQKRLIDGPSVFMSCTYQSQLASLKKENKLNDLSNLFPASRSSHDICIDDGGENNIFIPIGAVAIAVVAVVVIAGVESIMNVHFAVDTYSLTLGRSSTKENNNFLLNSQTSVLDAYTLKNGPEDMYIMRDKYIETIVDQTVKYIKENKPEYFKNNSEEEFRNTITINYINNIK